MITTTHHLLFYIVARDSARLEHRETRVWWSKRAIAAFVPVAITAPGDPEKIERNLRMGEQLRPQTIEEWDELYAPQSRASVRAVRMAIERDIPLYCAQYERDGPASDDVIDWLNMLAATSDPMRSRLPRIAWNHAVIHARKWMRKRDRDRDRSVIAGLDGTGWACAAGRDAWYRLETASAIRREGGAMLNCLSGGSYDDLADRSRLAMASVDGLYSLRNAAGRSKATALVHCGEIIEAHQRRNQPLSPPIEAALAMLQAHLDAILSR